MPTFDQKLIKNSMTVARLFTSPFSISSNFKKERPPVFNFISSNVFKVYQMNERSVRKSVFQIILNAFINSVKLKSH